MIETISHRGQNDSTWQVVNMHGSIFMVKLDRISMELVNNRSLSKYRIADFVHVLIVQ